MSIAQVYVNTRPVFYCLPGTSRSYIHMHYLLQNPDRNPRLMSLISLKHAFAVVTTRVTTILQIRGGHLPRLNFLFHFLNIEAGRRDVVIVSVFRRSELDDPIAFLTPDNSGAFELSGEQICVFATSRLSFEFILE